MCNPADMLHIITIKPPSGAEPDPIQVGDIHINPARRAVEVRDNPVEVRPSKYPLLLYFMAYGYIRVSPCGQNEDRQFAALSAFDISEKNLLTSKAERILAAQFTRE